MQRIRHSGALLATILATAVAVAPARHGMHMRALHLTGGANATSLAPEPKAPSDASLTARLFGAIRKTVRLTLRLLGFGKDDDASDDAAPATGKKKKAAAKKRRSPARASPAQRQAQRISRELTDFVENRAEINHPSLASCVSRLSSRVDGVRADVSEAPRRRRGTTANHVGEDRKKHTGRQPARRLQSKRRQEPERLDRDDDGRGRHHLRGREVQAARELPRGLPDVAALVLFPGADATTDV